MGPQRAVIGDDLADEMRRAFRRNTWQIVLGMWAITVVGVLLNSVLT
jgi:hypothetical protein